MNYTKRITCALTAVLFCFSLTACGGGSDTPAPTEAVVTFTLVAPAAPVSVAPTDVIAAVDYALELPAGFTLATEADGSLAAGVVTSIPAGTSLTANFIPEALPAAGQLLIALSSEADFAPGPLFRVIKSLGSNEPLPDQAEFIEVILDVYDASGALMPGVYTMTATVELRAATL